MDALDVIVSLVSFIFTINPKKRHQNKAWRNMGYLEGTFEGMEEHRVALGKSFL
jgi:hypothetical protein